MKIEYNKNKQIIITPEESEFPFLKKWLKKWGNRKEIPFMAFAILLKGCSKTEKGRGAMPTDDYGHPTTTATFARSLRGPGRASHGNYGEERDRKEGGGMSLYIRIIKCGTCGLNLFI